MHEAVITLTDDTIIKVYVQCPNDLVASMKRASSTIIYDIQIKDEVSESECIKIKECNLIMSDGTQLYCSMTEDDIGTATSKSRLIIACEEVFLVETLRLTTIEQLLDNRMQAVAAVINNIPDKRRRLNLHEQYLHRKTAYIAALEALLDGQLKPITE